MSPTLPGIHHVTAIAGDPQRNLSFYAGTLALRLVKLTVNYDDPGTYHLYYGDGTGQPGTILTFFPWRGVPRGRAGAGQVTTTSFSVPARSLPFWTERLRSQGVAFEGPMERFGERLLTLADPDGMQIELVAAAADTRPGWPDGPVPADAAIRGFHSATLTVARAAETTHLLTETMRLREVGREGDRTRFALGDGGPHALVDVIDDRSGRRGLQGAGSVHHIAWRTPDDEQEQQWLQTLLKEGLHVSPVMDRTYFHSIYYREPSGVLFEIATDPPGFTVDEPVESFGSRLILPAWLEPRRAELEQTLPRLELAGVSHA